MAPGAAGYIQHQFEFKPAPLKTKGAAPGKSHNQSLAPEEIPRPCFLPDSEADGTKDFLLELLSESRELLFQVGDFFLEDCDIAFQARDLLPHG